ncbi:MAG: hypothetical protein IJ111_05920 [Eggerthellaceae bacterium]|nr:hypothetical protein [Eggerthellaceae bacterium]
MSHYRHTQVRASFTDCNIKGGKIVLKFEVGADDRYTLPTLALLTGEKVTLDISSDQAVLLLEASTGEIIDQEPDEDQMTIDEAEDLEKGEADEPEEDDDSEGEADLPPAAQEYAPDDELDAIFGADAA